MTDADTTAAIDALVYRVKARDKAIRDGEDYPDAEPFALEFLTALRGQGWRHTEAKAFSAPKAPAAVSAATLPRDLLAEARASCDAATEAQRARAAEREAEAS